MAAESGPVLSWTTVISAAAFLMAMIGGGWTVLQTQFSSLSAQIVDHKREVGEAVSILQGQLDRRMGGLDKEVEKLHTERMTRGEFNQFQLNIFGQLDTIKKQLSVLEQTRPTVGELQGMTKNTQETAARLEDRIKALEQYIRAK